MMLTQSLFDIGPTFKGKTITQDDVPRLTRQLDRVRELMLDGVWRTLAVIAHQCECSEASASARLRQLRNDEGCTVDRVKIGPGLYKYRVTR